MKYTKSNIPEGAEIVFSGSSEVWKLVKLDEKYWRFISKSNGNSHEYHIDALVNGLNVWSYTIIKESNEMNYDIY